MANLYTQHNYQLCYSDRVGKWELHRKKIRRKYIRTLKELINLCK